MKTSRLHSAFTLIELIAVITIISILMALLLPYIAGAKESARRTEAGVAIRDVANACRSYYTDYSKFPPVDAAKNTAAATTNGYMSFGDKTNGKCKVENNVLFDILRGISRGDNVDHIYNKRQQKYISQKKAVDKKLPRNGFVDGSEFPAAQAGQLMDPWGAQYCIILETDGNEEIDMSDFFTDLTGASNVVRHTAVGFSMGKDSKIGGKDYENKLRKPNSTEAHDDVVSWE